MVNAIQCNVAEKVCCSVAQDKVCVAKRDGSQSGNLADRCAVCLV